MRNVFLLCLGILFYVGCDVKPDRPPKKAIVKNINIKAFNNKFVCADATVSGTLVADRDEAKEWEEFIVYSFDSVTIALKSSFNSKYISSDGNKDSELIANRDTIGELELFTIIKLDSGRVAFKAFNGGFVSADQTLNSHLVANRKEIGAWEKFIILRGQR